jgi:hypothetical protein
MRLVFGWVSETERTCAMQALERENKSESFISLFCLDGSSRVSTSLAKLRFYFLFFRDTILIFIEKIIYFLS